MDLADDAVRAEVLAAVGARFRKVVVLTEGLLVYLPEPAVADLARALHAQPAFAFWMMDLVGGAGLRVIQLLWNRKLADGQARMQFGPLQGARWFAQHGWAVRRERGFEDEGARLRRGLRNQVWGAVRRVLPEPVKPLLREGSGVVWLERR